MAALLKSADSKEFVGSNPTLSATTAFALAPLAPAWRDPAYGEVRSDGALMTTVPASRSNQPRLRLSMKIQMYPM